MAVDSQNKVVARHQLEEEGGNHILIGSVADIESEEQPKGNSMFRVEENTYRLKPYRITILINGNKIIMKVDTGAPFTEITEGTWTARENRPPLQKSNTKLHACTREKANVSETREDQYYKLPVIVDHGWLVVWVF